MQSKTKVPQKSKEKNQNVPTKRLIAKNYAEVRNFTEYLCRPLVTEDYVIQSMPDVSPMKWHIAHTSWFFETFVLSKVNPNYESPHPQYSYLFNSYYVQSGKRHPRPERGLLSRPTVEEVYRYRRHVDENMREFLEHAEEAQMEEVGSVIEIGIHHEQQHQELMLTDIKHVFSVNPLRPAYVVERSAKNSAVFPDGKIKWVSFPEGVYTIGYDGDGFAYDNECPQHREFIESFQIASRLVTNREYLEFMEDGGYERPELWLSDGWTTVELNNWNSPLYWEDKNSKWLNFTLSGMSEVNPDQPVCHISYYEADAYARWAGVRLPTEAEWETAASKLLMVGNFADNGVYHPLALSSETSNGGIKQMFGDVWEWTQSSYSPYPGFKTLDGALGEYNGKFMSNQMVLRGGSCATSRSHIRKTYRNFFPPGARWQFMGIRLAKNA